MRKVLVCFIFLCMVADLIEAKELVTRITDKEISKKLTKIEERLTRVEEGQNISLEQWTSVLKQLNDKYHS